MEIYLDNAATTKIRPEVQEAMAPWLSTEYGNPSSHHAIGRRAAEAVRAAREIIAKSINAEPDEIFFTSGGSESNTWAVDGLYCVDNGGHILMTNIEHHSLINVRHKKKLIGVDSNGYVDIPILHNNIEFNTPIVCVMMANNEIGTIEPISTIDKICYDENVFLHVDAVQAYGHLPIDVKEYMAMSTMSASGHKIGAPKGIGFLYIQRDVQQLYHSLISGGQQEFGKRGGTENVAAIVGLAKASILAHEEMQTAYDKNRALVSNLWDTLAQCTNIHINGLNIDSDDRLANNLNIRIDGVRAEELIELLSSHGVYVSSGSACNSDDEAPSHVLTSIGLTKEEANSSIRITLGNETTKEEIDEAGRIIMNDINLLRGE